MITAKDAACIEKLAPIAQLLELMGQYAHDGVRSPEVFTAMARDVWRVYWYLSARFSDEMLGGMCDPHDEAYYREMQVRVNRAVEEL